MAHTNNDNSGQSQPRAVRQERPEKRDRPKPEKETSTVDDAKQRSDWEGMSPKPEQPSDEIAAPGQVPGQDAGSQR
jgi:hypothetical protein